MKIKFVFVTANKKDVHATISRITILYGASSSTLSKSLQGPTINFQIIKDACNRGERQKHVIKSFNLYFPLLIYASFCNIKDIGSQLDGWVRCTTITSEHQIIDDMQGKYKLVIFIIILYFIMASMVASSISKNNIRNIVCVRSLVICNFQ